MWVRLLKVPYRLMFPAILMFCCIGIYSINTLPTDVLFIAVLRRVGYVLIKFGFEPAPLLLGFVLGKLMEENLRRALILSRGELHRPSSSGRSSAGLLAPDRRRSLLRRRCCPPSARAATRCSPRPEPTAPRPKGRRTAMPRELARTSCAHATGRNRHEDDILTLAAAALGLAGPAPRPQTYPASARSPWSCPSRPAARPTSSPASSPSTCRARSASRS